jgi:hypothetical protein
LDLIHHSVFDSRHWCHVSNDEFENYLGLLSHLLRLGSKQRDAIAGELRAHLEDRLDDLLARGVPREQAVRQALEEFGDAAGLAAEFASISRNKRRRWIMRLTTASVAAIVLIAAGIFTFWPGSNAGPGQAAAVAQAPGEAGKADPFGAGAGPPTDGPKEILVKEALDRRMSFEYVETPLREVFEHLRNQTGISIYINLKKLEEAGVQADTPITHSFKRLRLSTFFDLMLGELDLVYVDKDDILVITTQEDAANTMAVRVYDCRDLLAMPAVDLAGPGAATPAGAAPGRGTAGRGYPGALPGSYYGTPNPGIGGEGGLPGSAPGGAAPSRAVPGIPGESSLRRAPQSEALPQAVGPPQGSVPGGIPSAPGMMPGGGFGGAYGGIADGQLQRPLSEEQLKAQQLMDIVTTAVDPDSWQDQGGPGTIGEYNGLIVVRQSAKTHTQVEKVLDMLREAAGLPKSKTPRVVR